MTCFAGRWRARNWPGSRPWCSIRRAPGQIAKRNVGVRWRHPGLDPSRFLAKAIYSAAVNNGLPVSNIEYFLRGNTKPYSTYSILIHGG